jgi:subtilisin-like proprotein convertase family protein/subtilisin family serine protease
VLAGNPLGAKGPLVGLGKVIDDPVGPTLAYVADGETIEMAISDTRIALAATVTGRADSSWQAEYGLTSLRPLAGSRFDVYATTGPLDGATLQALYSRGVVDGEAPVFEVLATRSEAVLLDEAIVELAEGITPGEYFAARPVFSGYRPLMGTPNQFVATLSTGVGTAALETINGLAGDEDLAWATPNFHQAWQRFFVPDDPRWSNLWHLQNTGQSGGTAGIDADLPAAWDVIQGGSTALTIGVVDDGVSTDHPDLNVWTNPGEVVANGIDDDGNGWIDDVNGWNFVNNNNVSIPNNASDMHGTSVAGVAAARGNNSLGVTGASYGTPVLSSRIFAGSGVATDANIAAAIYYAAGRTANGLGTWKAADLSNHSWGGGSATTAITAAFTWATGQGRQGKGAAQLVATGNDYGAVSYPATLSTTNAGVIGIGAINNKGERSDYSNWGAALDVVTPSNDTRAGYLAIDTTDRVGTAGYNTAAGTAGDYTGTGSAGFGGTSSATPLATGIAALAIARGQALGVDLTPPQIKSLFRTNTRLVGSGAYDISTGRTTELGFGMLSAASLVRTIGTREISVTAAGLEITSGSTVSFGSVLVDDTAATTLRIRNQGTLPLTISGMSASGDFSVNSGPGQSVLGLGEATTFTIRFAPSAAGLRTGTVTILSNDTDEGSVAFTIQGTGLSTNVSGYLFEDADGDAIRQSDDTGIASRVVFLDANGDGTFDSAIEDVTVNAAIDVGLIPDGTATGAGAPLVSTLAVSGLTRKISDVEVTVSITHTYVSDLDLVLIAPSGRRIELALGVGGSGDNFTGTIFDDQATTAIASGTPPFTGRFRPAQPLSALLGEDPNGTWSLEITDFFQQDQGTLTAWSIRVRTGEQSAVANANGFYSFSNLAAGTYSVASVLPAGWSASGLTSRAFTVTGPASTARGNDLGSAVNNRFYGRVFDDANGNGVKDPTEPGIAGRTLFIDTNGNGTIDPPVQTTFTTSTPVSIPDKPTTGFSPVTSSIVVSGIGTSITDVNVRVNITHTFDADLDVFLIAPDGTRVELFTDVGGSGDNFTNTVLDDQAATAITAGTAPFTGTFRPEGSLATLNGKNPNGTWRLEVTDDAGADVGTLNSWSVIITTAADVVQTTDANGRAHLDLAAGATSIMHVGDTGRAATQPSTGVRSVTAAGAPLFAQTYGVKQRPSITSNAASVTVAEGTAATVTGTWGTPYAGDTIILSASSGSVTRNADGTWSWTTTPADQAAATTVTITATDPQGITSSTSFSFTATNAPPAVAATSNAVTGTVLQTLANTGTWSDVAADTVTLSASLGTVTKNSNGTWSWSLTPSAKLTDQTVTISAIDEDGGTSTTMFTVTAKVAVASQRIYHLGSSFAAGGVDAALDPGKSLARPGSTAQPLSYANLINGSLGLNGIVIDVAGLASTSLTAADFSLRMSPQGNFNEAANPPSAWAAAPAPSAVVVTAGTATTPARVRLEWADNVIVNRWLQIAVLASTATGLDAPEIFYVGHLTGEVNGAISNGLFRVTNADYQPVAAAVGTTVTVGSVLDIIKDGRIRNTDVLAVSQSVGGRELRVITIPVAGSASHGTFGPGPSGPSRFDGTTRGGSAPGSIDFAALAAWAGATQTATQTDPATPTGSTKPKR